MGRLRFRVIIALAVLVSVIDPMHGWSQDLTTTLSGVVVDQTGAVIANASVVIVSDGTALKRETTTNAEGVFTFSQLPPGTYTVRATSVGFAPFEQTAAILSGTDPVTLKVELKVEGLTEDVMVTALKREQRLQDVPASVVAASAQTLADLNVVEVAELDAIAPGLTFATKPGRFGSGPSVAIRGINTFTQSAAIQDSVAIVLDGIPVSRAKAGAFPDLSDVERIEVLRGPQGTLFGKNASAGLISITTKDPTNELETEVKLGYSAYNDRTLHVSLSGPIVRNGLLGRISLFSKNRDGFITNIFDGSKWDNDEQKGVRGSLVFLPTARDKVKVSADFIQQDNDAGMRTAREFLPSTPQYAREALGSIVGTKNDKINARSIGDQKQRTGGAALQWDRSIGSYALTALAGYRAWTQNAVSATYNYISPLNEGSTLFSIDSKQYSGELRLASPRRGRVDYVTGLFVFADDIGSGLYDPDPLLVLNPNGTPLRRVQRHWINNTETMNYAVFGEMNTHITALWTLTTGLRWTQEKVDATIQGLPTAPGLTRTVVPLGTTTDSQTAKNASWRLGSQWRLDEDRMFYVSAATGFKGPGFNVVSSILGNAQPVTEETSTSFEGGLKSQFVDRRVTTNLSVYYATYRDFQTQGFSLVPGTPVAQVVLSNAAKLETKGFEAELAARVTDSTEISTNAALIDATFKEFKNAQCYAGQPIGPGACSASGATGQQDLSGKRLTNTPRWAFNLLAKHVVRLPASWSGIVTLDYGWKSSIQWDLLQHPLAVEEAYGLWGASLGFRDKDERFGVKIYGKNLTNKFHTSGLVMGEVVGQFLPVDYRRLIGVDATLKF